RLSPRARFPTANAKAGSRVSGTKSLLSKLMPLVPRYLNPRLRCGASAETPLSATASNSPRSAAPAEPAMNKPVENNAVPSSLFLNAHKLLYKSLWLVALALIVSSVSASASVRIRDLVMVAGARDNQLVGYGLVVGLAGDGDKDPVY